METLFDPFGAVSIATLAKYALLGAVAGAILMPLIIFLAMRLNYKRIRDVYRTSRIPETPRFYRLLAIFGAVIFAIIAASQPVLDAAGDNEVYLRGALIPVLMIIGIPFFRALRRRQ